MEDRSGAVATRPAPAAREGVRSVTAATTRVLGLANERETDVALQKETDAARELSIFDSPTLVVDRELFWGDDRLEDAVSWYRHGRVGRT
jgi:2-hydroxychromene-2-carboxylate isomerase